MEDKNSVDSKAGADFVEGPNVDCHEDDYHRKQKLKREDRRLETFKDWPKSIPVSKEELAKDGFYYMKTGDKVKCIFCNLVLKNWEAGDSARAEHLKFNASCPFLRNQKVGNIAILADHPPPTSIPVKHPEYAARETRLASFANWPRHLKQDPRVLAEAGFFYAGNQDAVSCFFCGGVLRNWEPEDDPWAEHRHWFPFCEFLKTQPVQEPTVPLTPLMKQCIGMGYDKELVEAAAARKRRSGVDQIEVLNDLIDEVERIKLQQQMSPLRQKPTNESHAAAGPPAASGSKSTGASSSMEEKYRSLKEEKLCKICMEQDVEVTFLPCGHLVTCNKCAHTLKECPICRQRIRGFVRTYWS